MLLSPLDTTWEEIFEAKETYRLEKREALWEVATLD
jgi:hypothetical protein